MTSPLFSKTPYLDSALVAIAVFASLLFAAFGASLILIVPLYGCCYWVLVNINKDPRPQLVFAFLALVACIGGSLVGASVHLVESSDSLVLSFVMFLIGCINILEALNKRVLKTYLLLVREMSQD
jgi:hypothetical protein